MSTLIASHSAVEEDVIESMPETLADLVHRLGDIPLERIRMRPAPGTAVEQDVIPLKMCELIDGVVVEKAMSFFESRLAMVLVMFLETYSIKSKLGFVVGPDAQIRMSTGRIRIPDVSFLRWDGASNKRVPTDPIGPFAPDLAVEILSPGNTKQEMIEKRRDYFTAGTRLVWIVDAKKKSVSVYRTIDDCRVIQEDGSVEGEEVLPGFALSIKEWFETATGERDGETTSQNE